MDSSEDDLHPYNGPNICDRCKTTYHYNGRRFCNGCMVDWKEWTASGNFGVEFFIIEYNNRKDLPDGWF